MRIRYFLWVLILPVVTRAQEISSDLVTASFEDVPLEVILDTLSAQTGYFFSYNPEIFPPGSRYTMSIEAEAIDQVLSRLFVGTGLKYSFFKDQIIINYEPPAEQTPRKRNLFNVTGQIVDEEGQPIEGANVFLDGTTLGTYTDAEGRYELESIPPGYYDLVFSHIGFQNGVYQLSEYNGGSRIQNHQLVPDLGKLQAVEVISDRVSRRNDQSSWLIYYQDFKEELLGNSAFSQECVIENPEVLNFYFDDSDGTLTAFADSSITIRNDALGYRIDYFLETFRKEANNLRFRGKLRFSNQAPRTSSERNEWRRNRKKSYLGSINHFKKSLLKRELKKEGFRIYTADNLKELKRDRTNELTERDILVLKRGFYELNFKKNLIIEYRKEKESMEFLNTPNHLGSIYQPIDVSTEELVFNPKNQISIIRLLKRPVKLDLSGQIVDKFAVTLYGYMSWERIANLVPLNYDPKWDKF